jgi:DNA polymerase-3 subunit alpha
MRIVNRKTIENLMKAGAFDQFVPRHTLLHNLDLIMAYAARLQKQSLSGQVDLFGEAVDELHVKPTLSLEQPIGSIDSRESLLWERELLGLYLSRHPLEIFEDYLAEQTVPLNTLKPEHDGKAVVIGGSVLDVREITTKNGQKMAFVRIEDRFGETEVILFPSTYQQTIGTWERDKVVLIRGKVNSKDRDGNRGEEVKIMVDDAREITVAQAEQYQTTGKKRKTPKASKQTVTAKAPAVVANPRLYIKLKSGGDTDALMSLKSAIDEFRGETDVVLVLGDADGRQIIKLPGGIDAKDEAVSRLTALVGAENIKLQ